jgi:hypothetical protein
VKEIKRNAMTKRVVNVRILNSPLSEITISNL